jgi:hypothetical protein
MENALINCPRGVGTSSNLGTIVPHSLHLVRRHKGGAQVHSEDATHIELELCANSSKFRAFAGFAFGPSVRKNIRAEFAQYRKFIIP